MPAKTLKAFLDSNQIKYTTIQHSAAFTAQEVAQAAHVTGKEFAKTVIIKIDGRFAMAVLPSNRKVLLQDLREITGIDNVTFASEDEFKAKFPDCEVGAMPPFGNLYGMEVFAAPGLEENEYISFNAGTHTEIVRMRCPDFERLVHPKILSFTT
jgi:Ala-tRNA(Pro) deacylase